MKGYKMPPRSAEHRRKISENKKGTKMSAFTKQKLFEANKGRATWNKGLKLSPSHREKLSQAKRGSKSRTWKGGISSLNQLIKTSFKYRQWRSDIFTRDGFVCILCGKSKVYLNADHIKPKAAIIRENKITTIEQALDCEELWNLNNGRTLCVPCHKETPTYGNNKN